MMSGGMRSCGDEATGGVMLVFCSVLTEEGLGFAYKRSRLRSCCLLCGGMGGGHSLLDVRCVRACVCTDINLLLRGGILCISFSIFVHMLGLVV